jgi:hypothetical protein
MSAAKPDLRKQLLFVALEGRQIVGLDEVARAAAVSTQFVARELKRLGWCKRGPQYYRPQDWGPAR